MPSTSRALDVDVTASYARRAEGAVHLVLSVPQAAFGAARVRLRLRNVDDPGRVVRVGASVVADGTGRRLEARIPAGRLRAPGSHVWRIAVRAAPGEPTTRLRARLLARGGQPVALLPGRAPRTRMPPPSPRLSHHPAARAQHRAIRAVESTLSRLPQERAARYRDALRTVAARLRG